VEGLHCLLGRCGLVEAVDLQEVDVRRVQAAERGLDLVEDGGARETKVVLVLLASLIGATVDKVAGFCAL
jgi:hypothetical protein